MRTFILYIVLLFTFCAVSAQNKEFVINWSESVNVSTQARLKLVPGFEPEFFSYSPVWGIKYHSKWKVNGSTS
ncbi:MAG: hypothetical protein NWQ06_07900, partial [Leeuwenhoekiella sp.]|nr:hypothetical protein [Leeuwenhoekiella sp.]